MEQYYVIRDKTTGLYFRGKGVNRWGKYYNQASIYRVRGQAEFSLKEIRRDGEQPEIVPIQITESPAADVKGTRRGKWVKASEFMPIYKCSICNERNLFKDGNNVFSNFCPNCGAKMGGDNDEQADS